MGSNTSEDLIFFCPYIDQSLVLGGYSEKSNYRQAIAYAINIIENTRFDNGFSKHIFSIMTTFCCRQPCIVFARIAVG